MIDRRLTDVWHICYRYMRLHIYVSDKIHRANIYLMHRLGCPIIGHTYMFCVNIYVPDEFISHTSGWHIFDAPPGLPNHQTHIYGCVNIYVADGFIGHTSGWHKSDTPHGRPNHRAHIYVTRTIYVADGFIGHTLGWHIFDAHPAAHSSTHSLRTSELRASYEKVHHP